MCVICGVRWRTDQGQVGGHAVHFEVFPKVSMRSLPQASLRAVAPLPRFAVLPEAHCGRCALHVAGLLRVDTMRRQLKKRDTLYYQGDACRAVYAVCSGTLKSAVITADGTERIIGFPVPGEVVGLDGSANGMYTTTVTALEDTEVCSSALNLVSPQSALAGLGREMARMHQLLIWTGSANADVRLAHFLHDQALQRSRGGCPANDFELKMSRADIGSYLGLSLETVSRSFSALQRLHLLKVDKRSVSISDLYGLLRLAQSTQNRKWHGLMQVTTPNYSSAYQSLTKPVISAVIKT